MVRTLMVDILFIYAKLNPEVMYRQVDFCCWSAASVVALQIVKPVVIATDSLWSLALSLLFMFPIEI